MTAAPDDDNGPATYNEIFVVTDRNPETGGATLEEVLVRQPESENAPPPAEESEGMRWYNETSLEPFAERIRRQNEQLDAARAAREAESPPRPPGPEPFTHEEAAAWLAERGIRK